MDFQAETKSLLDIVTHSLYTDKEVFVRELISNSSDALEKVRHVQAMGQEIVDPVTPLEIRIWSDDVRNTITIQDTGIGMTEEEVINNLGTIARSGSKAFLEKIRAGGDQAASNIIGQFGVGFYSVFMVADRVTVFTRSATPDSKGLCWTSDGSGSYEIGWADNVARGTKVIIHLKDSEKEFAAQVSLDRVVKKFSNFVGYPILLDGKRLNTVQALWMRNKNEITDSEYADFYRFIANAFDTPLLRLHFATDSPLSIRSILFVPEGNMEKIGMGRMEAGVNLYCRRVLIQHKCKSLLPDWLRFVRGVVDSEDIPLNISRENMQDSSLIRKINSVLTKRLLKEFAETADKRPDEYRTFWNEFAIFIKEGICTDSTYTKELSKLLRFESSKTEEGENVGLEAYVSRMKADQKHIYFLVAPNRVQAEASPYMDPFLHHDIEVIFLLQTVDEVTISNLRDYNGKMLLSIDSPEVHLPKLSDDAGLGLSSDESQALIQWLKEVLKGEVRDIKVATRHMSVPAIVTGQESQTARRMASMLGMSSNQTRDYTAHKVTLEINPRSPIIARLAAVKDIDNSLASTVAAQVLDNALMAANLLDDTGSMLHRIDTLLSRLLGADTEPAKQLEEAEETVAQASPAQDAKTDSIAAGGGGGGGSESGAGEKKAE